MILSNFICPECELLPGRAVLQSMLTGLSLRCVNVPAVGDGPVFVLFSEVLFVLPGEALV